MKSDKNDHKTKAAIALKEEEIQQFWEEEKIFELTLEKTKNGEPFVFYDGPPFATGLPHYGHIVPGTIKDIIPRYQTMKGKFVRRKWGWDCHGLPIENLVEEELGLKNKEDIEEYGIEKFNDAACNSVMRYDKEWKAIVPRLARWVDMEESYKTMDWQYSESIWWAFKELWDKKYIYEGYKSMHICPRCETTLSNNEVADGYKDIKDISVTAKFELVDEPGTFVLAWTTTPWTLPGNAALAVGKTTSYVKVKSRKDEKDGVYILAKDIFEKAFKGEVEALKDFASNGDILDEFKGGELVGKEYKPLFNYYSKDESLPNRENGWKIYTAGFVNTEDGTGVVHIAPAFGEDDMNLGNEHNLPFIQHVKMSGHFKDDVTDFAGQLVKPRDNHQEADIEIVKYLAHAGTLFSKLKYEHSYPHCWRCKTPLLNYATGSWFVKVTAFVDKLTAQNKKITWVPDNIKEGRFGNWLEGARDWAISRTRYWGAPLPVWKNEETGEMVVIGSIKELQDHLPPSNNTYTIIRHGEAESNVKGTISTRVDDPVHLTEKGKEQVLGAIAELKNQKFDLIIASPLIRTRETAKIIADKLDIPDGNIQFDDRLREIDLGGLNGKPTEEYHKCFASEHERFDPNHKHFAEACPGGENLSDVKRRMGDFLYDIDDKYDGKKILIVSHDSPLWLMQAVALGLGIDDSAKGRGEMFIENAQKANLNFKRLPHNRDFEIDLHRPHIDSVILEGKLGSPLRRIPEVFDCWFESGSMPYAQLHYPFENKETFKQHFPADFIAEGVDQTRGWFYNMLVLSTGIFGKAAFRNVVVNGVILAEDGQKMSKSLKNYPDPMLVVDKYGADALRYYLMSSPVVRSEALNFSEKGVGEVYRKVIVRFENVLSFYAMYKGRQTVEASDASTSVLDRWIISRLKEVKDGVSDSLDTYELDRATRPIGEFVDDLSTWYLRRSRNRIKAGGDDMQQALATLQYVLLEFSKITAPFMPFVAERVYQKTKNDNGLQSVHLETWPKNQKWDKDILETMSAVRGIVSESLELRAREGVKVRQPLKKLVIGEGYSVHQKDTEVISIIADEINVKDIAFDTSAEGVKLDFVLTPELILEGQFRELVRNIQSLRKETGLTPDDFVSARIKTNEDGKKFIEEFSSELKKITLLENIVFEENVKGLDVKLDELTFIIALEK